MLDTYDIVHFKENEQFTVFGVSDNFFQSRFQIVLDKEYNIIETPLLQLRFYQIFLRSSTLFLYGTGSNMEKNIICI